MSAPVQRLVGAIALLILGVLSLPVGAAFLDGPRAEDWIVPVQLAVMAVIGAGLTVAIPALAPVGASAPRRAAAGVVWGLVAALVGVVVFWLLLSGFGGA